MSMLKLQSASTIGKVTPTDKDRIVVKSKSTREQRKPRGRERERDRDLDRKRPERPHEKNRAGGFFPVRNKSRPKQKLQLMTKDEFSAHNAKGNNDYAMLCFIDVRDEEEMLNNMKLPASYGDYAKAGDGKHDSAKKPGCIYEVYFGKCGKTNCPYEHDEHRLVPEKTALVKRLTEELRKVPSAKLQVMQDSDSDDNESSADESVNEAEDSDREAEEGFEDAFVSF